MYFYLINIQKITIITIVKHYLKINNPLLMLDNKSTTMVKFNFLSDGSNMLQHMLHS